MKKIFLACMGFLALTIPLLKGTEFRRLAMYFDHNQIENSRTKSKIAMASHLGATLHEKTCPIILSQSIFDNFLMKKYAPVEENKFLTSVKFNPSDWEIYLVPGITRGRRQTSSHLFVLLPQGYDERELITLNETTFFTIPLLKRDQWNRFDISSSPLFSDKTVTFSKKATDSIKKLMFFVKKDEEKGSLHTNLLKHLSNIFVFDSDLKKRPDIKAYLKATQDKELKESNWLQAFTRSWNIFIAGHGGVNNTITGLPVTLYPSFLQHLNTLNINLVQLKSCSMGGENVNYLRFISMLSKSPNARREPLSLQLRFILIINSIADAPTASHYSISDINGELSAQISIKKFFELIENQEIIRPGNKLLGSQWFKNLLSSLSLNKDWYFFDLGINSIPQVLIPHVKWVTTFDFNKDIFLLNKTTLQKHIYEKQKIIIQDKLAVLISSEIVLPALWVYPKKINKMPEWLPSLMRTFPVMADFSVNQDNPDITTFPKIISVGAENTDHIINTISIKSAPSGAGFLSFIRNSFFHLGSRRSKKTFYVEKLEAYNDIYQTLEQQLYRQDMSSNLKKYGSLKKNSEKKDVFKHVFIQTEYSKDNKSIITVAFSHHHNYWKFEYNDTLEETMVPPQTAAPGCWYFDQLDNKEDFFSYLYKVDPKLEKCLERYEQAQEPLKEHSKQKSLEQILKNRNG